MIAILLLFLAAAGAAEVLYQSPRVRDDRALFDKLLYSSTVDNSTDGLVFWWRNVVQRDGTAIRLYFRSAAITPGYSVCFRWQYLDSSNQSRPRSFCATWYDKELHWRELLSADEAARMGSLTIENFDVEGDARSWDGFGRPPRTLAHERRSYRFDLPSARGDFVYSTPGLAQGNPVYEKLLYSVTAGASEGAGFEWGNTRIVRRGDVRVYFQSKHRAPDHAVCFWWRFVDDSGQWRPRQFCGDWLDQALHSEQILSAAEARRVKVFHLHNFDVDVSARTPGVIWNGGYPSGMIAHQFTAYSLVDPPMAAVPATPSPVYRQPAAPSASEDAELLAIGKCALMYLGEEACKDEVEEHLGRSIGGLSCAAFLQEAFGDGIDPAELAIGALADAAAESESGFWQIVGGLTKLGLFAKCVDENR